LNLREPEISAVYAAGVLGERHHGAILFPVYRASIECAGRYIAERDGTAVDMTASSVRFNAARNAVIGATVRVPGE